MFNVFPAPNTGGYIVMPLGKCHPSGVKFAAVGGGEIGCEKELCEKALRQLLAEPSVLSHCVGGVLPAVQGRFPFAGSAARDALAADPQLSR